MKRLFLALLSLAALTFTACNTNNPDGPIPDSFPKKHLIEEFTGQDCGYCPDGMNCISDFTANDTNFIVVLHHYGYKQDHFTVSGSKTITNTLGVSGAPSMTIDRAKTKTEDGSQTVFHPGYLPTTDKAQFATTTYASIEIKNSYNPDSRVLTARISGAVCTNDHPELYLTIMVKESGMLDVQADYYGSFEGWKEFRHTNAVRAFLTDAKGDVVTIKKQRYETEYSVVLDDNWVPENCMVVAILSENFKPVIQAEERPVVAGSKGGSDITHGGVTPVPVADYYPEPNATYGPSAYSGKEADTLTISQTAITGRESDINEWNIRAADPDGNIKVNGTRCIPFVNLYLYVASDATTLPTGTYELNRSGQIGTAYAGYRNDELQQLEGCIFYYTGRSSYNPKATWMIADGTLTITEEGWELIGHTRNGADIHLVGSTPIEDVNASAPAKLKRL